MSAPLSQSPANPTSNAGPDSNQTTHAIPTPAPPTTTTTAPPAAPATQWSVQSALATIPTSTYTPHPPTTQHSSPSTTPLPFLHLLERLKTTKREGWRRFSITSGESIADHMYRMSIMTMLAPPSLVRDKGLDVAHCTKMALVHDMAESLVGDITPVDGVEKEEKARREAETMAFLCRGLLGGYGDGAQGESMRDIFLEYEEGETLESKFVHDIDKIELLLQMVEYEKRAEGKSNPGDQDLGEFSRVVNNVQLEEMKEWCREILKERVEFWKRLGKNDARHLDVTV